MASDGNLQCIPGLEAGADLSAAQYRFMELTTGQATRINTQGELAVGVLQNAPAAQHRAAEVAYAGVTKVVAGATVTTSVKVMSDNEGRAIDWTTGNHALGVALEAGAAAGDIFRILLLPLGVD